jgi:DNA-binding HxlR family transcriptional regulator
MELRRDADCPAPSTLRGSLEILEDIGAIEKKRCDSFPGTLEYDLTEAGKELLRVAASLERWLSAAPGGSIELGSGPAKAAIKGLVEGWCAHVLTMLAAGPLSLTQLDKRIATVSYPTLERCLATMRLAEQLDAGNRTPRGTPYALTDWLRRGLTPFALAARWEHRHQPDGADSITHGDINDALMLGGPLFTLSGRVNGVCQLAVKIPDGKRERSDGFVEVKNGQLSFGETHPQIKPDARASGTMDTWFATMIDADTTGLRMSGNREIVNAVFASVHTAFFEAEVNGKAG